MTSTTLVWKRDEKKALSGSRRHGWENNIKTTLKFVLWGC